jgi:putative transposase
MLVRKCYRYRLYPTNSQAEHLQWVLDRCRELYNAALQERREAYDMAGAKVSYYAHRAVAVAPAAESHRL